MSKKLFNRRRSSTSNGESKGVRLGWVSLKDAKKVKLEEVLKEREEVRFDHSVRALLVP